MSYSKAYQQVIAGRVRENEQIAYYGHNKITTPAGNFTTQRTGGSTMLPKITINYLQSVNVGKLPVDRKDNLEAYGAGSNNSDNS